MKVADIEGTVIVVGMFSTKLHTGMGEEVSVPNSVVVGHAVHNFSRLGAGRFRGPHGGDHRLFDAVASRARHAAGGRTAHAQPTSSSRRPTCVQTALVGLLRRVPLDARKAIELSPARRVEVLTGCTSHVQDVFNENGVQIMSPHYVRDPAQPQVVAPGDWSPGLAPAAQPASKGPA